MSFWLWESLPWMYRVLGLGWTVVAVLILVFALFAPLSRALVLGFAVLIGTQCWHGPTYCITRAIRWWVVAILAVRAVRAVARLGRSTSPPSPGRTAMLLMGALAVGSALWAKDPRSSILLAASFVMGLVIIFIGLWRVLDHVDLAAQLPGPAAWFGLLVFGASYLAVLVAWATNDWPQWVRTGWEGRFSGIFINANMLGLLGATLLPLVAAAPRQVLGRISAIRWLVVAAIGYAIFLSGSRSAIIGSAGALILILFYRNRAGAVALVTLGGAALWAGVTYAPLDAYELDQSAFGHITRTKHLSTLSGRFELWELGLDAARENPVAGGGWGASRVLHDDDFGSEDLMSAGGIYRGTNLHSAHIQILVDLGWTGLLLFWIYCADVMRFGLSVLGAARTARNETLLLVFASAAGMIADTFVHGGVFSMGSPSALIFWAFGTVCLKEGSLMRQGAREERLRGSGPSWRPRERPADAGAPAQ